MAVSRPTPNITVIVVKPADGITFTVISQKLSKSPLRAMKISARTGKLSRIANANAPGRRYPALSFDPEIIFVAFAIGTTC